MTRPLFAAVVFSLLLPAAAQARPRTVYRFEDEVIKGEVHKPEVMMVITRQNLKGTYTLELRESFLPKIVDSVETEPF
ncbi:MAG: hypothetical protein ABIO70_25315 [Pseudomonadota bacterium]